MVLYYCRDTSDIVNLVIDWIDEDFIRIGQDDYISINEMKFFNDGSNLDLSSIFKESFTLEKIKTVWYYGGSAQGGGSGYENESYNILFETILEISPIKKLGRSINKFDLSKLQMHLIANSIGFYVPSTLVTGNKKILFEFYNEHLDNGIICKRVLDTPFYENNIYLYDFTRTFSITKVDFNDIPEDFAISLFQEKIISDFEIKTVFIENTFYAMAIYNSENFDDYRSAQNSNEKNRLIPFLLPNEIKNKLKKIFHIAKLNYGTADLLCSKDKYYFLEINPIGQIGFVNNICNYYIEEYISKLINNEL